jgi:hypothetical protein
MRSIIIFIAALVIIVGCHSEDDKDKNLYTKIDLSQVDEDFVLPSSLWSTLEGNFPELTLMTTPLKEEKEETSEKKVKTVEEAEEEELLKKRPSLDSLRFTTFMVEKLSTISRWIQRKRRCTTSQMRLSGPICSSVVAVISISISQNFGNRL